MGVPVPINTGIAFDGTVGGHGGNVPIHPRIFQERFLTSLQISGATPFFGIESGRTRPYASGRKVRYHSCCKRLQLRHAEIHWPSTGPPACFLTHRCSTAVSGRFRHGCGDTSSSWQRQESGYLENTYASNTPNHMSAPTMISSISFFPHMTPFRAYTSTATGTHSLACSLFAR